MDFGGFDQDNSGFEKKFTKKQVKWMIVFIVSMLIVLIIFS
jgi:hypothetical protein